MQEAVQQLRDQLVEQKRRRRGKRGKSIESCSLWSGSTSSLGRLPTQQEMGHGKTHGYEGLQPELLTQVWLWHQPRSCLRPPTLKSGAMRVHPAGAKLPRGQTC